MQIQSVVDIDSDINIDYIGYQYDSRDGELFLESGYKYVIHTVTSNDQLLTTELNLGEDDAI